MGHRREARERAVQFLFQHDLNPRQAGPGPGSVLGLPARPGHRRGEGPATWGLKAELPRLGDRTGHPEFADRLIRGVVEHRAELDQRITQFAQNWDLKRIAVVDRNVLRLAIYEMSSARTSARRQHQRGRGHPKKFPPGTAAIVNGILDKIKGELMRPARIVQ